MSERLKSAALLLVGLLLVLWPSLARPAAASPKGEVRPNFRRFDFGPYNRAPWPGFTRVSARTNYDNDLGFGWVSRSGSLLETDRVYPEELDRGMVLASSADFVINLPDGDYQVWLRMGDAQLNAPIYWIYRGQKLSLNGQSVLDYNPSAREIFEGQLLQHYEDPWFPGMDVYGTFVESSFSEKLVTVKVTRNVLRLHLENVPLTAMMVYPLGVAESLKTSYLPKLHRSLRDSAHFQRKALPQEIASPAPTAEEMARGLVLFSRDPERPVYPTSRPEAGERVASLDSFAARGQGESLQFSLWPLRDLDGIVLEVGTLNSPDGSALPASAVDVRQVRYMPFIDPKESHPGKLVYSIEPYVLDHQRPLDLPAGTAWRFWIRITVPEDQPSGTYSGTIHIRSKEGELGALALNLEVLPIALPDPDIAFGSFYGPTIPWYSYYWKGNITGPNFDGDPEMDHIVYATERANFSFMKKIGHNGAAFTDDLRGQIHYRGTHPVINDKLSFVRWMDEYTRSGLKTMPFYGFQGIGRDDYLERTARTGFARFSPEWMEAYRNFALDFSRVGRKRGWPEILWYVADELSNQGPQGVKSGQKLAEILRGLKGIRTIASMNGRYEYPMVPVLDISMPNFAFPITPETLDMIHRSGSELWIYNCTDARFTFGFYPWGLGARGRYQWHYGFPRYTGRWGLTMKSPYFLQNIGPGYEVFAMARAEAHEQGINDFRYLQTLEQAIAAGIGGERDRQAAKAFLRNLRMQIPVDLRPIIRKLAQPEFAVSVPENYRPWTNTRKLDRLRRRAADLLMRLKP